MTGFIQMISSVEEVSRDPPGKTKTVRMLHFSDSGFRQVTEGFGETRQPSGPGMSNAQCLLMQVETVQFNQKYGNRQESTPLPEFLMLALREGRKLYTQAFRELAKKVCLDHERCISPYAITAARE